MPVQIAAALASGTWMSLQESDLPGQRKDVVVGALVLMGLILFLIKVIRWKDPDADG